MSGAVVENLSTRKLFYILTVLAFVQVIFFLIGAILAPKPSSSMSFLMTKCHDASLGKDNKWIYLRPRAKSNCKIIDFDTFEPSPGGRMRDIVFVAQMPHARSGLTLEYSPWFQFMLGLLDLDIEYSQNRPPVGKNAPLELEVRLGYRTASDANNKANASVWHELISTTISRHLDCSIAENQKRDGSMYNCSVLDLFELGSSAYPFYLINIRIPADENECEADPNRPNCAIGKLKDLNLVEIHQNGGFTKIWLSIKTLMTPVIILGDVWYWNRVKMLNRPAKLLEKSIFALGISLAALDFPLEWLSLWFRMPYMLMLSDLRQGVFYAILLSFWLIFTGEHLVDDSGRNALTHYWRHLTLVAVGTICMLVYDMCERGMQLANPFYTIWSTNMGTNLAYSIIYLATACAALYLTYLTWRVRTVWLVIRQKQERQNVLVCTGRSRALKLAAVVFRFKFLMLFTLICAALTVVFYLLKQYGEGQMHADDYSESPILTSSSAFFTGTFGMWNIYVLLLLAMYAPSHKSYAVDEDNDDVTIDSTVTEQSALTTFTKSAVD